MIKFEDHGNRVVLAYSPDQSPADWLDAKLDKDGSHRLAFTFTLRKQDLLPKGDEEKEDGSDVRRFVIGVRDGEYRRIRANSLGLKHDVLIDRGVPLTRSMFIAQQNISIFSRIGELSDEEITIGGDREGAIPTETFFQLLNAFPTTTEMRHYSHSRVTRILKEHMGTMSDAEAQLEEHFERRRSRTKAPTVMSERLPAANQLEMEKFTFVRERMAEMLDDAESYSEAEWQRTVADLFLLVFPQYVAVLQKVRVRENYSRNGVGSTRELDLVLVAANGTVDVLEIKKPFSNGLMSARTYRDNHVPVRELSGTIVQVEKYLFYLNKSGPDGEQTITAKHATELPDGLHVQITNPKAYVLSGRDTNFTDQQAFDFEFVRRKYSNLVDIITYDDLLRRLDNILLSLRMRTDGDDTTDDETRGEHHGLQELPIA
ncbi:Shedu immune nuclease family protein [Microbacterium sp. YY-03]|uniref:Shedu immune nuclease family protein n=1 Tax=Microbacterium sp. YY-03 TaxID=3421636 RepID=UPI003D17637F